jgi:hypothetical protein
MLKWIALWLASLAVVAGFTSALTRAQAAQAPPPYLSQAPSSPEPTVVSGPDIGFRVESIGRNGRPTGTLVIRVKGQWVPVNFGGDVRPAH